MAASVRHLLDRLHGLSVPARLIWLRLLSLFFLGVGLSARLHLGRLAALAPVLLELID